MTVSLQRTLLGLVLLVLLVGLVPAGVLLDRRLLVSLEDEVRSNLRRLARAAEGPRVPYAGGDVEEDRRVELLTSTMPLGNREQGGKQGKKGREQANRPPSEG